ncbi:MAG: hypothetical protein V1929_00165 [bacterium]
MKVFQPGHVYILDHRGVFLVFRRRDIDGSMLPGTTTCELLEVLIHRVESLDKQNPCMENIETLHALHAAHGAQLARTERISAEEKGT